MGEQEETVTEETTPVAPTKCPKCDIELSSHGEYGSIQVDGDTVWQEASCNDCGHEWTEYYQFSHID